MRLLGLWAKKSPKVGAVWVDSSESYLMALAAITMLAKTANFDSKTAVTEKTQKNKRALLWVDFRDMVSFLWWLGKCNKSPCDNCGD